jgi:hypothetical protein
VVLNLGGTFHGASGVGFASEELFRTSSQLASSSKIWFDFFPESSTNASRDELRRKSGTPRSSTGRPPAVRSE